jgi:carbon-monoxide dehydrogenase medium subunit
MIPAEVEYLRAGSLEEALTALGDPDAKVLAGGQSLVSVLKLRLARPSLLVDIGGLELRGVEVRDGHVRLGALSIWDDVARAAPLQRPALMAIAECAADIGDLQVRNRGTIGGSLAHADPASDLPAVMLALGATFRLRSAAGERAVQASDFFVGPFLTTLEPQELLTHVVVALPPTGSGSAYVSIEHPASGFALAGAAALVLRDGSRSVGITGVSGRPSLLESPDDPSASLAEAGIFGDHFASAEYRKHVAGVVVRRALERAQARAKEDLQWKT